MHFLQSSEWKKVKESQGYTVQEFEGGWFQVSTAPLGVKIGYCPRADLNKINFQSFINEAVSSNCIFVKVDPSNFKNEIDLKELLKPKNIKYARSKPVQLQKNLILDLTQDEETIFNNISRKDRYSIRYGSKNGVTTNTENASIQDFIKLYEHTAKRHGFVGRNYEYLLKAWQVLNETGNEKIITTSANGRPLVSSFLFLYEDTAYYTYTGSDDSQRNLRATYHHLWEVIKWVKESGFKKFDYYGLDENLSSGFSSFKLKFGGDIVDYADTFDVILKPVQYRFVSSIIGIRERLSLLKKIF